MTSFNAVTIPGVLKARPQWVCWRFEDRNGKRTKVPYDAKTGQFAASDNPATWATYEAAAAAAGRYDGIGYVFSEDDPFVGIDLDMCIDEVGVIAPWAKTQLSTLNSYSEISPSGRGIKIWAEGSVPGSAKPRRAKIPHDIIPADAPGGIEIYAGRRFFTVTGRHVAGTPREIRPANGALTALYERLRPAPLERPTPGQTTRPAGRAYLERWAERTFAYAIEQVRLAGDGERHNTRFAMARLLGGLIPHGLATADQIADVLFSANPPAREAQRSEYKTLLDGINDGARAPLTPPPEPEQPTYNAAGIACCPKHGRILEPARNGNGYTCRSRDKTTESGWCRFWWDGDGYVPPARPDEHEVGSKNESPTHVPRRIARSQAILEALEGLGYSFRLNLCSNTIEVNGAVLDDILAARIRTEMRDLDFKDQRAIEDVYTTAAAAHAYHPIRDYLDSLVWDGGQHIMTLGSHLTCDDPPVVYPDRGECPLATVYLWRWLIGAVAKVYEQAQNLMLVLAGPQDIGKSAFVRWLCGSIPQCFIEAPINVADKDTDVRLMDRFIWEVAELDATTRKADVSALKAFITKQTVTVRKAYGRHDTIRPALASFVGTVNDGSGFLADETGNRRFYVTKVSAIDWSYTRLDVNQVWAQAVALYRQGDPWRLTPLEKAAQTEANKGHEVEGLLEDWIDRYFSLCQDDAAMSAAEIADHLRTKYDIRLAGSERAQAMEIARVMVKFSIPRRQRGGKGVREYIGVWPKSV